MFHICNTLETETFMENVLVIKANGEKENFSEHKLRHSISRAGVPKELHDAAVVHIKNNLYNNISTLEIYDHILEYLGNSRFPHAGGRFSLKKAIMDLGPTGFPFEKFIAAILREHGFSIVTDSMVNGLCVAHEVDVIAQKDGTKIMIECKFHNNIGNRTDIKVALYVMARYQDLTAGLLNRSNAVKFNEVWLVTNTKCSQDAILYAQCMGMKIISWGYPEKGNLQDLVESEKLHPVTCLTSISPSQKKILLDNNIVLAKELLKKQMFLDILNLPHKQKESLLAEIKEL